MDTDSGLNAESSQHICLSYVCHKPAGSKTALEVAHTGTLHMKFKTKASKKMLAQQISVLGFDVEYASGHNRKVGDAADADFEWSKGAVRP